MTEFSVSAASLVLLLLGLWTIGGYQELQRRSIVAARQAAFEGAWSDRGTGQEDLRARLSAHFDDPGLTAATGSAPLASGQSMRLETRTALPPGQGAAAADFLLTPLRTAGGFLGSGFDLDGGGFRAGSILLTTEAVPGLPMPFRNLRLEFRQPFALLSDGWNAAGPSHVADRAGGLAPGRALAGLTGLWTALSVPLAVVEPSLRQLCPGLVEPDRVPEDRLGPGRLQPGAVCN